VPDAALPRAALAAALSLPPAALRLASGGAPVYRGGRTLDPRMQFLAWQARRRRPLEAMTAPEARLAAADRLGLVAGVGEPGVSNEALTLATENGPIRARVYRPTVQDPVAPALVFAHLGGVVGDLETSHAFCGMLAAATRAPVLSVEYRLAPEDRFPAGLDDLLAAYRWTLGAAASLGAPAGMAAVGGDSIGGGFAAAICQELRRHGEPQPALQLLVYPILDLAPESPSAATYADAFPLSLAALDWLVGHYLGPEDDPADPRLSPARAGTLAGLAPAVIAAAGFDPTRDAAETYARGLIAAGTPVVYRCYDSLAHGFASFTGAVPAAAAACREIAGLVRIAGQAGRK